MTRLLYRLGAMAIVVVGVALSAALVGSAGAEQCPDDFTQAQVDASDCIIGANVGLGLVWIFAVPAVMAGALLLAALVWRRGLDDEKSSPSGGGG